MTRSAAEYVPARVYVYRTVGVVPLSKLPSPSRSHAYVNVSPGSGSREPRPSKDTVNGARPFDGDAVAAATGG